MKENLVHYRTSVCNINYHMVWSVKYRKKIITPEIESFMRELAIRTGENKGFSMHLFEAGGIDHIHCFVSAPPKYSVTFLAKCLKGILGRKVFEQFPDIHGRLWKDELWNRSYYVETIGCVSEENIRRYIGKQNKAY